MSGGDNLLTGSLFCSLIGLFSRFDRGGRGALWVVGCPGALKGLVGPTYSRGYRK